MENKLRSVSIIIPTYNRAKLIGITLESCINQSYPKNLYEIIVADNNSTDNTRQIVEEWKEKSSVKIRYLFEPRQGAHIARNEAAKISESEILYFTDDDMIPDQDALKNIVTVFDMNYNVAVAGGKVLPKWEFDPPDWLLKYFNNGSLSLIDKSEKLIIASYDIGIYSCHQAILKNILFKCGGFNPDIVKEELIGDGETGLNMKIFKAGYDFAYVGDSVSYHMIPGARMTQKYFNKRFGNQGNSDSFTMFTKKGKSKKHYVKLILFSHIPSMFSNYFNSVLKRLSGKDLWRIRRANFHYYIHRIKSDLKLATNNKWRAYVSKYNYMND
ncbi:MAG: glycosyltransferase [Ignavibacteria bacterium]|nr:glycosyltransferase [Ignavibacteria bacterium]